MSQCESRTDWPEVKDIPVPVEDQKAGRPPVYYDVGRKDYWMENDRGDWITVNETSLKRHLKQCGVSTKCRDGDRIPEIDMVLNEIQRKSDVPYAGPLAGYRKGVYEILRQRVLVTQSPKIIQPRQGGYPILKQLLDRMFREDQLPHFRGWLKIAYESIAAGHRRPGQVMVFAGERDSGKSLLQNLITEILGGRAAKPYRYMSGGTDFNRDLFGAEHLMIEDEVASTDIRARRHFGARIKDFTVNVVQSCHGKNREAISLTPFWRVSVSLNEEPENLLILPPMDESLMDKIMLLKVHKSDMPMPSFTMAQREAFWKTLVEELPSFLWDLQSWEIPEELQCERFGVQYFQHPELMAALEETTPEVRLLALIDAAFREGCLHNEVSFGEQPSPNDKPFEGTAECLTMKLFKSTQQYEAKKLLDWHTAAGTYLGRLAQKRPGRVSYHRTAEQRIWRITPPPKLT